MSLEEIIKSNPDLTSEKILELFRVRTYKQNVGIKKNSNEYKEYSKFKKEFKVGDYYKYSRDDYESTGVFKIKLISGDFISIDKLIILDEPTISFSQTDVLRIIDLKHNYMLEKIDEETFNKNKNQFYNIINKLNNINNQKIKSFNEIPYKETLMDYMHANPTILGKDVNTAYKTYKKTINEEIKKLKKENLKLIKIGSVLCSEGTVIHVIDIEIDDIIFEGVNYSDFHCNYFNYSEQSFDYIIEDMMIIEDFDFNSLKQEILNFKLI
jgi:hypothetical protein